MGLAHHANEAGTFSLQKAEGCMPEGEPFQFVVGQRRYLDSTGVFHGWRVTALCMSARVRSWRNTSAEKWARLWLSADDACTPKAGRAGKGREIGEMVDGSDMYGVQRWISCRRC